MCMNIGVGACYYLHPRTLPSSLSRVSDLWIRWIIECVMFGLVMHIGMRGYG